VLILILDPVLAADDTVARLRAATGHDTTVQPLQLDPSDPDSIKAGVAKLRETRDGKVSLMTHAAHLNMASHAAA
jgi:hypothetical protein